MKRRGLGSISCILSAALAAAGCLPVPVSTVPLHPRQKRPVAVESPPAENGGAFSSPVFDASGAMLAAYDSGSGLVRVFRSADLALVDSLKPARRPRRLSFSPGGRLLVIEAHQGWVDDYLTRGAALPARADIDSPEATLDDIQRAEVWNLETGETTLNLACDAVQTTQPQGGWLWARRWAITPGYRSSALLEAHVSADEKEFSILCWNGVQQRWDARTWQRLEDAPPPPFWDGLMARASAQWLAGNDAAGRSVDGRTVLLRVREKTFGFGTLYLWDRNGSQAHQLPGACASRLLPVYALSDDGRRVVAACGSGMGYAVRAWDLGSGEEIPLENADFGFLGGAPTIRGEGIALSPDGRYLAVALLEQLEALLPNVLLLPAGISRSDLRLWRVDTGKEVVTVGLEDANLQTDYFRGVDLAFSPDAATLAVGGSRLRIYRLSDLDPPPR
jgi:WD40 repeat protein